MLGGICREKKNAQVRDGLFLEHVGENIKCFTHVNVDRRVRFETKFTENGS